MDSELIPFLLLELCWETWYPLSSALPLSVQNQGSLDAKVYLILQALASPGCSATLEVPCPGEYSPFAEVLREQQRLHLPKGFP